jgi:sulfide:quinone oxidoreductase
MAIGDIQRVGGRRPRVLIAGGGIAALEAVLTLDEVAGDALDVTILTASPRFEYRPLAVAQPFENLGRAYRFQLADLLAGRGIDIMLGRLAGVDVEARTARSVDGFAHHYDALLIAIGTARRAAIPGALTFAGLDAPGELRRLLGKGDAGHLDRLAFAVPDRATWSLPAYELALMAAAHLADHGRHVNVALATPERRPVEAFGAAASAAVEEMLRFRGIAFHSARPVRFQDGRLLLAGGDTIQADAAVALPAPIGPMLDGLPSAAGGFLPVDDHGRVRRAPHVYAAGDVTDFGLKQGGMAAQQAEAAATTIAAELGFDVQPRRFEPALRGLLLTGPAPRALRAETLHRGVAGALGALGAPTKVAGRHVGPFLARHGIPPGAPLGAVALELAAEPEPDARIPGAM